MSDGPHDTALATPHTSATPRPKPKKLFEANERDLIRPGVHEKDLSKQIYDLGFDRLFGIKTHWLKRVVRSGPNTLCPSEENPNDRVIEEDDILFADLGPVFETWEADFGRTFVPGSDVRKLKLRDALEPMWHKVKAEYIQTWTCLAKNRTRLR
ncbi:hypothetical protein E4U19_008017 [Claviceps sp. Clav32 group G5]|nr:hypothetical protein E4U19_008017 [Claviceps sp. Clav32 group G5]